MFPHGDSPEVVRRVAGLVAVLTVFGGLLALGMLGKSLWTGEAIYKRSRYAPAELVHRDTSPEKFRDAINVLALSAGVAGAFFAVSGWFYRKLGE